MSEQFQCEFQASDRKGNVWYKINGEVFGISTGGRCMDSDENPIPINDDTLLLRQKLAVLVSTEIKDSVGVSDQLVHFAQEDPESWDDEQ